MYFDLFYVFLRRIYYPFIFFFPICYSKIITSQHGTKQTEISIPTEHVWCCCWRFNSKMHILVKCRIKVTSKSCNQGEHNINLIYKISQNWILKIWNNRNISHTVYHCRSSVTWNLKTQLFITLIVFMFRAFWMSKCKNLHIDQENEHKKLL